MRPTYPTEVFQKASKIRLLICDVDGVLTDGRILLASSGVEYKSFHVQDGFGLKQLQHNHIAVAVMSNRESEAVTRRMQELGIEHLYQGVTDKLSTYMQLLQKLNLSDEAVAYCGDDLPDLPVMESVGLSIAVANANWRVKEMALWQTTRCGGEGAVREVCDLLLFAQKGPS